MKNIAVKLITISSQTLIVSLFILSLFAFNNSNNSEFVVNNSNFSKMADKTSNLFKNEELSLNKNNDDDQFETLLAIDNQNSDSIVEKNEENESLSLNDEKINNEEKNIGNEVKSEDRPEKIETSSLENNIVSLEREVLQTVTGNLTGYGADCYGCSGRTSSGYDLRNSIYYNDEEFGSVRIVASDPSFPLYSIFRISNVPNMDPFIAIVLDRGGNVGFGRGTLFDLAFFTESDPNIIGLTHNVTFELLRSGK